MSGELMEYNQKRDFARTGEPEGKTEKTDQHLRFVVQHHSARTDHFDFRLEWEGVMLSWAVPKGPSYDSRDRRLAVEVENHPLEYRNFEGTIPEKEYGGGTVMIWDEGYWEPQGDAAKGLADGDLKIILHGKRLKGKWVLVRLKPKTSKAEKNWLLIKEKDEYTLDNVGVSRFATSIRTGRTMEEIAQGRDEVQSPVKNPFDQTDAQPALLVDQAPEGADWLFEIKFDGYRILSYLEGGRARLLTRNGQDYTEKFKDIAASLIQWAEGRSMVLDGEVILPDASGKADFQALQNHLKNPGEQGLAYMVFDLLALDGGDLRRSRLADRKEKLEALMKGVPENIRFSSHMQGSGKDFFLAACRMGLEGIIGKKADSIYSGTRNGDWVKVKCGNEQEFVIGGYTLSSKKNSGISSLLLGVYEGDKLVYAGRAGTGFSERTTKELMARFRDITSTATAFTNAPEPRKDETITWLEPTLAAQIRFAEWTGDNVLRQASFKGLRSDKDPRDIKREHTRNGTETSSSQEGEAQREMPKEASRNGVRINDVIISSPDKAMYEDPVITKEEAARYYSQVAERMLVHAGNRILSIVRCPDGISGECFFQKHPMAGAKGIIQMPVSGHDGTKEYFYIENAYGLIWEVQMGTLEFHTWGSRASQPELPDTMVFDLDPGEGVGLDAVREGVRDLKRILDEIPLACFLKTSGGKGYHVIVPLEPSAGWEAFSGFAKLIAEVMVQRRPDRYTSNMRKDQRTGKIFIDWMRNGRGATSVAPYSLRARKGAPVSMPISWGQLDTAAPDGIRLQQAMEMSQQEDPWKDYFTIKQRIRGEKL